MSMMEKIARAIHTATYGSDVMWRESLPAADAVLAAFMEPTEGMIEAGNEKMNWGPNGLSEIWPLMIQAAKDGK